MTRGRRIRRRRCGGQVLVIVLLGIVLLTSLVFYVVNVGGAVTTKVEMQNSADSAALAAATWMARSFNVIAMNNVAQTRMLALVPVLDALPLSVRMAYEEIKAWEERLERQINSPTLRDNTLRDGLKRLKERMTAQREILEPMDAYLNPGKVLGRPMTPQTTWRIRGAPGPPPHGHFWQAAESLDAFSQATSASASGLSLANAVRFGSEVNQAETAFVVPVLPTVPARRGSFADFESAVKKGRIPDHAYPHRLGVYDRLFKWRHYKYRNIYERSHVVPGDDSHGPTRGGSGHVNVSGRVRGSGARGQATNPNPHWAMRTVGRILEGYTVYGPYEWAMGRLHSWSHGGWWQENQWHYGALGDTYFHEYQKQIADIKLGYMWQPKALQRVHFPLWITDYPQCKALAEGGEVRVQRTMFYRVEIRSKYPKYLASGAPNPTFMTGKTYVTNFYDPNQPDKRLDPIAMWVKGWEDPAKWGIPQIAEWVWEDTYEYETQWDRKIGILPSRDAAGNPKWHKVYMIAQWVFGGIDVGGEVEVTNPANYSDPSELPAPILLELAYGDYDMAQPHHDLGVRREVFTHLGVAAHNANAQVWPKKFRSGNPFGQVTAVAQAEIFNTTSWDLWTQDWKAKLVPVTGWQKWVDRLDASIQQGEATQAASILDPEMVRKIHLYFSRFDPDMADGMLQH